jgi:hypothetical protein
MNVLHNMSAPPRTKVTLHSHPVSPQSVVYSLTFALSVTGAAGVRAEDQGLMMDVLDHTGSLQNAMRRKWRQPQDLLAQIGVPVFPEGPCDFLIGWRPSIWHFGITFDPLGTDVPGTEYRGPKPEFCRDPRRCAGVLSRCVRTLYLSRRAPDFSWDTLFASPVAFDEPLGFPS